VAEPLIQVQDLRVDYDETIAVKDLSLEVPAGTVYGLVGPNGAGKTTTLKALATMLDPTYGKIFINGINALEHREKVRPIIGFMPDYSPVYSDLTVWEFLDLYAAAYRLEGEAKRKRIEESLSQAWLQEKRDSLIETLSHGMQQRLVLAKTLLHDPRILILDEPANGLDPIGRIELRNILRELGSQGRAVVVSSHILTELSDFCNAMGIMEKGVMVLSGSIDEIRQRFASRTELYVEILGNHTNLGTLLQGYPHVVAVTQRGKRWEITFDGSDQETADLLSFLMKQDTRVVSFHRPEKNMEDIFLESGVKGVS
jgi:ABC-2 type transport system ATP-binding protein